MPIIVGEFVNPEKPSRLFPIRLETVKEWEEAQKKKGALSREPSMDQGEFLAYRFLPWDGDERFLAVKIP